MDAKRLWIVLCLVGILAAACGPEGEQQAERILSGAAETAAANITVVPADTPVATLDVNVIVKQTFAAMTQQAAGQKKPTATLQPPTATSPAPTATSTTGSVSGNLNYPGSSIPAMYVAAYRYGTEAYKVILTTPGQGTYTIDGLDAGNYWVIAYTVGGGGFPADVRGGYTKAVLCGLSAGCTDHTLIQVKVVAGQTTTNVNPFDWYAPTGTFMALPPQGLGQLPSASPAVATGGISGTLMYPAGGVGMPSLRIVAFQVGTSNYYYVDTALGQNTYQLDNLPPATYHVVAYVLPGGAFTSGLPGGYTQMVPCGLQYACTDHTLIGVMVTAGHVTTDINPNDYYAPSGAYPPDPVH